MPIPDDLKAAYPDDWDELREHVLERAERDAHYLPEPAPCCEWCGVPNGAERLGPQVWVERTDYEDLEPVERLEVEGDGTLTSEVIDTVVTIPDDTSTVVLTVAHMCSDPRCDRPDHLRALCQACHLRYDNRPDNRERIRQIQAEIRGQQTIGASARCKGDGERFDLPLTDPLQEEAA